MIALRRLLTTAFCLLAFLAGPAFGAISFIYPAPGSWVKKSDYLILKLNSTDFTGVKISVNGEAGELFDIGSPEYRKLFQDIVIVQPAWDPGRNRITVAAFRAKEQAETASAEIYYYPGSELSRVPPEYKPYVMHLEERDKLCAGCHNMAPTVEQMSSSLEKQNPCFGCHKRILTAKYVHGPAGTYSCGYCHTAGGSPKYHPIKREAELCNSCHGDKEAEFRKRKYVHGPIEAGMCEVCHDPHGSAYQYQLRAPVNELCLSCHDKIRNEFHVVRTPSGEGHPLGGKPDPSRPGSGREMSCVSCHAPHSADVRYFFRNNVESRLALCQMCHQK